MNHIETIDKLYKITSELSDIVREQEYLLAMHGISTERANGKLLKKLDALKENPQELLTYGDLTGFDDAEIITRKGD